MLYRSNDEIALMGYRDYKIDVWRRLADGWREKLGVTLHDQDYVKAKVLRCEVMSQLFADTIAEAPRQFVRLVRGVVD